MKRGTMFVVLGIVLMIGGPAAGWVISAGQEADAQAAVNSGAPSEIIAEYIAEHTAAAMYATAAGYAVCILGIIVLITGLVMRARAKRAQPSGSGPAA